MAVKDSKNHLVKHQMLRRYPHRLVTEMGGTRAWAEGHPSLSRATKFKITCSSRILMRTNRKWSWKKEPEVFQNNETPSKWCYKAIRKRMISLRLPAKIKIVKYAPPPRQKLENLIYTRPVSDQAVRLADVMEAKATTTVYHQVYDPILFTWRHGNVVFTK